MRYSSRRARALAGCIWRGVRQRTASRLGLAITTARHLARLVATFRRFEMGQIGQSTARLPPAAPFAHAVALLCGDSRLRVGTNSSSFGPYRVPISGDRSERRRVAQWRCVRDRVALCRHRRQSLWQGCSPEELTRKADLGTMHPSSVPQL